MLNAQDAKINLMSLICFFFSFRRSVLWECQINKQSVKNSLYSGEAVLPEGVLKGFSEEGASELSVNE